VKFAVRLIALTAVAATASATSWGQPTPTIETTVAAIDRVAARSDAIDDALRTVLQLKSITLFVRGGLQREAPVRPTVLYERLAGGKASALTDAFASLIDATLAGTSIPRAAGNCDHRGEDDRLQPVARTSANLRAAQRLDALSTISIVPCQGGLQINTKATNDNDSFAIAVEERRTAEAAANAPYNIRPADRQAVMLAQAYRFSDAEDSAISIPSYLARQVGTAITRTQKLFSSLDPRPPVTVVFDRGRTESGAILSDNPKGWFSAYFEPQDNRLYLSPTLLRASLISCASQNKYLVGTSARLKEIRVQVTRGYLTPMDPLGTIESHDGQAQRIDTCMAHELDFLIGHELSHAIGINEESRADCIGIATINANAHDSIGVFKNLILDVAASDDFKVLGVGESGRERLLCRAQNIARLQSSPQVARSFKERAEACIAAAATCE